MYAAAPALRAITTLLRRAFNTLASLPKKTDQAPIVFGCRTASAGTALTIPDHLAQGHARYGRGRNGCFGGKLPSPLTCRVV
jgi:hypothetical protein